VISCGVRPADPTARRTLAAACRERALVAWGSSTRAEAMSGGRVRLTSNPVGAWPAALRERALFARDRLAVAWGPSHTRPADEAARTYSAALWGRALLARDTTGAVAGLRRRIRLAGDAVRARSTALRVRAAVLRHRARRETDRRNRQGQGDHHGTAHKNTEGHWPPRGPFNSHSHLSSLLSAYCQWSSGLITRTGFSRRGDLPRDEFRERFWTLSPPSCVPTSRGGPRCLPCLGFSQNAGKCHVSDTPGSGMCQG